MRCEMLTLFRETKNLPSSVCYRSGKTTAALLAEQIPVSGQQHANGPLTRQLRCVVSKCFRRKAVEILPTRCPPQYASGNHNFEKGLVTFKSGNNLRTAHHNGVCGVGRDEDAPFDDNHFMKARVFPSFSPQWHTAECSENKTKPVVVFILPEINGRTREFGVFVARCARRGYIPSRKNYCGQLTFVEGT